MKSLHSQTLTLLSKKKFVILYFQNSTMTIKLYVFLFTLMCCNLAYSQKMKITGHVTDTTNQANVPLEKAVATLVRIKDSVLVDFRRTDKNGNFSFTNLPIDTFQLIISHPKIGENAYYFFGSAQNYEFDLKNIIIPPKSLLLKEVVIYAYKDPVFYKGDTLVYVADSFQTKPNAVVEDLLKKLPGIKVNADGSIEAQGKEIQQVLVDGDEFFGSDPTTATRNLGAQGVDQVQIYEKKDENATDDSETIQVLDLKLKDSAKKGYFGKVSGATDFAATNGKAFYEGEFLANKFNKTTKLSVFSLASNTMKSSLEWRDMFKYGMTSRNFFDEENDNWNWNFSNNQGEGIPTTFKTGVYFNGQLTKKTELNVNYTYSNGGLKTKKQNRSQYFLTDTSYVTDLASDTEDKNESHTLNFKLSQKLDSLSSFDIETNATMNKSNTVATDSTTFLFEDYTKSRQTVVRNSNDANGSSLTSKVTYRKEFKKKGRKLTSSYRLALEDNASDGNLTILDTGFVAPGYGFFTDQKKTNASFSRSHTAGASYIEPLGKKFKWEWEYEFYQNFNDQEKNAMDYDTVTGTYNTRVDALSNAFETLKNQHRVGTQFIYEHKKHRLSGGVRYRDVKIENTNFILNDTINQHITNFLPRARYVYKISQHNRFVVSYNTSSAQPTINQLQPVNDNTNPNRVVVGNPDLKPTYVHSFSSSYNTYKALSGTYFWSNLSHSITNNAFGNFTTYDNFGRITSKTVNVNGNTNSSLSLGGGFPILKKLIEVSPNINLGHSKTISYVDSVKNTTTNTNLGGGLELRIEKDSLEFSIGGRYSYNSPTSTISSQSNLPYSSQSYTADFLWKLPKGFFIETDASYTINSRRSQGYDLNFFIWNASITKSFLKNENLLVTAHVYDILNQNISANRIISSNVVTDTKSVIIARYFMARVTYKFNSTKTKEQDDFF